jgi:hypothetical protein
MENQITKAVIFSFCFIEINEWPHIRQQKAPNITLFYKCQVSYLNASELITNPFHVVKPYELWLAKPPL